MIVIATKNTKTLIKGKKYVVDKVEKYYGTTTEWYVELLGIPSSYNTNSFTTLSGKDIPEERYKSETNWQVKVEALRNAEVGDILMCKSKSLKTLTYGKYYTIAKIKVNNDGKTIEVSFKESPRGEDFFYQAWCNNFIVLPKDRKREININLILDEEEVKEMVDYSDPIFDNIERETMVLNLISKSLKYLYETKINASLQEIIEHRVKYEQYITMEDVEKFNFKKIMNY